MTRRGITLMELLVVVAILGLVAGMAAVTYAGVGEQADNSVAKAESTALRDACLRFAADAGRPPSSLSELWTQPADVATWDPAFRRGWRGPYASGTATEATADYRLEPIDGELAIIRDQPEISLSTGLVPRP
ncbi:MAG: prepilin-type N-terminal cleavage/methylation domain-containing protein [Planctomycetes bacterium]|nr:prepilin-type N-terminal cleavage/methylation domain-containing protein [Planctomycetota bacterium]